MKGKNMQKTITKYQSRFDRLMKSIEKDKILKKMPGNHTAGIAVQMIKDLKRYLEVNVDINMTTPDLERILSWGTRKHNEPEE